MKRLTKITVLLATLILVAIAAFCFAACGDKDDGGEDEGVKRAQFVGTYKLTKYVYDAGVVKTYNVGDDYNGVKLTEDYFVIVLSDDGKYTVTSSLEENLGKIYGNMQGEWSVISDTVIELKLSDGTKTLTVANGEINYYYSGTGLIIHNWYLNKK